MPGWSSPYHPIPSKSFKSRRIRKCRGEQFDVISLGKYGTFPSNLVIARPYSLTYELLDRAKGQRDSHLRIVPASELHASTIAEERAAAKEHGGPEDVIGGNGVEFQLVGENGEVVRRSNRETIDDAARQTLTMGEIEELKREGAGAGQELIAKLMASHMGLDEKSLFSLSKYKLLKTKKYSRRFTVLPLDVPMLTKWMIEEKDAGKILEFRDETLSLLGCWGNVHYAEEASPATGGRWLVVDETGGLLVAAMAERMGILCPPGKISPASPTEGDNYHHNKVQPLATSNTITLIHNNQQPNLSLLKYFSFDPNPTSTITAPSHPLSTHLLPVSWLQLISPDRDTTYSNPVDPPSPTTFQNLKSVKRGAYYRKLRRYTRIKETIDSTQSGAFSGLCVASQMDPISILRHTVHLLAGGAQVAIYSPTIEPLVQLADVYSTSRRTAFIQAPPESFSSLPPSEKERWKGDEDFPLNPTLLLNTSVQSSRVREWQVLPGRTHPNMTSKGGAEGFLFTGTKVIPAEGRVEARGKFGKKRAALDERVDTEESIAKRIKVQADASLLPGAGKLGE